MFKELKVDVILNRILNIIIILYPFFLIRRSGTDSLTNLILITTFICCLKNKKLI